MRQTCAKIVYDEMRLGEEGNLLGIVQEIAIWTYYQMQYLRTGIHVEWDT